MNNAGNSVHLLSGITLKLGFLGLHHRPMKESFCLNRSKIDTYQTVPKSEQSALYVNFCKAFSVNIEINDLRKIICLRKSEVSVERILVYNGIHPNH